MQRADAKNANIFLPFLSVHCKKAASRRSCLRRKADGELSRTDDNAIKVRNYIFTILKAAQQHTAKP
jgi:hypothetical protein